VPGVRIVFGGSRLLRIAAEIARHRPQEDGLELGDGPLTSPIERNEQ